MKSILQDAQFAERKLAVNSSAHARKESRSCGFANGAE